MTVEQLITATTLVVLVSTNISLWLAWRAIGRLEEKLSVVKPVNTAPPPVKTATGAGPVHNGDLSKLPMDQYIAARVKMGPRWAPR